MRGQNHGSMGQLGEGLGGSDNERHCDTSAGAAAAIAAAATTAASTAATASDATATTHHAPKEHRPISDGRCEYMPSNRKCKRDDRPRRAG